MIATDLKLAGIGQRPFIMISYSMGGVVTRHMIVKQSQDKEFAEFNKNLKGVAFIGSPLQGSTMRD
jgi:hypothetical protein